MHSQRARQVLVSPARENTQKTLCVLFMTVYCEREGKNDNSCQFAQNGNIIINNYFIYI